MCSTSQRQQEHKAQQKAGTMHCEINRNTHGVVHGVQNDPFTHPHPHAYPHAHAHTWTGLLRSLFHRHMYKGVGVRPLCREVVTPFRWRDTPSVSHGRQLSPNTNLPRLCFSNSRSMPCKRKVLTMLTMLTMLIMLIHHGPCFATDHLDRANNH